MSNLISSSHRAGPKTLQNGSFLLESLIAILLFALGILSIVGLQGAAAKQVADAKYRTEAALLANQLIGQMWLSIDRSPLPVSSTIAEQVAAAEARAAAQLTILKTRFQSGSPVGAGYTAWKSTFTGLPGVSENPPVVSISASNNSSLVSITIYWKTSNAENSTRHQYTMTANIK